MRSPIRVAVLAASLLLAPLSGRADMAQDQAALERATKLFMGGDSAAALGLAEGVLSHAPEDPQGLYQSALYNFMLNNIDAARGRLERLAKLSGNFASAWELLVQVARAQGDTARRDEAIRRAKLSISTAIDPNVRRRGDLIRERISLGPEPNNAIYAIDYYERGGSDFTRYQFSRGDPRMAPDTGLLLRTDALTTENWATTALLPQTKQLFHLDAVDVAADGTVKIAVYEYYVGEPDYDTVHTTLMKILRGEARPLSGEPSGLQGILKR